MSKLKKYDPALFELFERVFRTKQEIEIPFPQLKDAYAFALRMARLRKDMRAENHHLLYASEAVSIRTDKDRNAVVLSMQDSRYLGAIQQALAKLPEISKEVESHELDDQTFRSITERLEKEGLVKDKDSPAPRRRDDDAGTEDKTSPAEEALKKFRGE